MGKKFFGFVPDDIYLKYRYYLRTGKNLNLKTPKTFNEKLQWLKINDRKEEYVKMVDKNEAKEYVAKIIGKEHIIPTIGIYNNFDDIDFDKLPEQFVIKCTHDSGGVVICKDKNSFDIASARKRINKSLKKNYYYGNREWPYKNIKPRIIIEKYMVNKNDNELTDYKFFNFNGEPKIILVCTNRSIGLRETWFDEKFRKLDIVEGGHLNDTDIKTPEKLGEMIKLSRALSKNIPFVRTDFYVVNNKVYFGEITFFPASGFEKFVPEEWDGKLGELISL
ncbi:glycosyl transferase [Candidatus Saccharibacteria bacterium]|nr:glycosyl transferase [Candidatus Saccharibacteria bacterium]